jgi:GNAT superfamily N-acetyltransferase
MAPSFRLVDAQQIEPLLHMIEEFYREEQIPFDSATSRAAVRELVNHPDLGQIWLLELDGRSAGYMVAIFGFILEFGGKQVFLDELFVAPAFQRKGLGSAALQFLEEESRRAGARVLRLDVARSNSQALALYAKRGFELHDRQTMSKRLGPPA